MRQISAINIGDPNVVIPACPTQWYGLQQGLPWSAWIRILQEEDYTTSWLTNTSAVIEDENRGCIATDSRARQKTEIPDHGTSRILEQEWWLSLFPPRSRDRTCQGARSATFWRPCGCSSAASLSISGRNSPTLFSLQHPRESGSSRYEQRLLFLSDRDCGYQQDVYERDSGAFFVMRHRVWWIRSV